MIYKSDDNLSEEFKVFLNNANKFSFKEVFEHIINAWDYQEYITKTNDCIQISTGGSFYHEDILSELNSVFMYMYFKAWKIGGHYVFADLSSIITIDFLIKNE